jgi:DNA primase catalytic subunit
MEASKEFVYQKFADYYKDPSTAIPAPIHPEQREFGYLMFKERFMVRHRRFNNIENFRALLAETTPSDVYHSCAYYENPDYDMDKKGQPPQGSIPPTGPKLPAHRAQFLAGNLRRGVLRQR